jgi:hypothetical protein
MPAIFILQKKFSSGDNGTNVQSRQQIIDESKLNDCYFTLELNP